MKNIEELRNLYPVGTTLKLIKMDGENLPSGLIGTVLHVDDIGQIHVNWENGSFLALNLDVDEFLTVKTIKVVLLEPNKLARIAEIQYSLSEMQKIVGGYIETAYFFDEPVCLVCNEEGKINGMPLNRAVVSEDGEEILDIIAGTAFICDCSGEDFGNLSEEQLQKYTEQFKYPEVFFMFNNEESINSVPVNPESCFVSDNENFNADGDIKVILSSGYTFIDDREKMLDFIKLSKEEFLKSYSYLLDEEYERTKYDYLSLVE